MVAEGRGAWGMGEVMGIKKCTCGNEHWAMYGNVQSPCYILETHGTVC